MNITLPKGTPQDIVIKALNVIELFESGQVRATKLTCNKALVLKIGLSWRLIQFKGTQKWELMTHETYNRHCKRGRK